MMKRKKTVGIRKLNGLMPFCSRIAFDSCWNFCSVLDHPCSDQIPHLCKDNLPSFFDFVFSTNSILDPFTKMECLLLPLLVFPAVNGRVFLKDLFSRDSFVNGCLRCGFRRMVVGRRCGVIDLGVSHHLWLHINVHEPKLLLLLKS